MIFVTPSTKYQSCQRYSSFIFSIGLEAKADDEALVDLQAALRLTPGDKAIVAAIAAIHKRNEGYVCVSAKGGGRQPSLVVSVALLLSLASVSLCLR